MSVLKCVKCNLDILGGEVSVKCIDCASSFHPSCTSLGSSNLTKNKMKSWKCESCKGDSASVKSNEDNTQDTRSILDAISNLKKDINRNLEVKVGEVTSSVKDVATKMDSLSIKFDTLESNLSLLNDRCGKLELEKVELQREVQRLNNQLHDVEQHSRGCNLEIVGLPLTTEEDIYTALDGIARVIGVACKREDFSVAHRLRLYSKRHPHPPVIVQFISRSTRDSWLSAARRTRGVNSRDIAASLPQSTIYINEQLTGHNRALLGRARRLRREGKVHYVGYSYGKVLIRPREGEATIRVFNMEDLDKYDG